MIIEESKDRYIRVLEYKYMRVCLQMEVLFDNLSLNIFIDRDPEATQWRVDRFGNV
jgi:Ca2+-dependent lipid-binding protein